MLAVKNCEGQWGIYVKVIILPAYHLSHVCFFQLHLSHSFEGGKYGFGILLITKFFSKISLSLNFFETLSLSLKKEVDKRIFEPRRETLHRNVTHSTHFIFSTQRVQCYT